MKTWKLLWRMMTYRPFLYAADGFLWMIVHGAFIIPGLLAKAFFDALTGEAGALGSTRSLLWLIAAFALARIAHIYVSAAVDILHRFTMSALLRANAFEAIFGLPGASELSASATESLDYLKEDAQQAEDAISWTLDVLGSAVFTLASIVILVKIDPMVTLLAFAPLVTVVAVAQAAEGKVSRYRESARKASEETTGAIGDAFGAIQALKVAGAEEHALANLGALGEIRRKASLKDGLFSQLLESIYHNTVGIGTGIILLVVAGRSRTAAFSLGDFSLFIFCLSFVSDYTCFWGSFLAHYQRTAVSFERLKRLVRDESGLRLVKHSPLRLGSGLSKSRRAPSPPLEALRVAMAEVQSPAFERLSLAGLSCLHPSGRGVVDLSFELSAGELIVVTGRIGSGKTTLLRAIQGLLPSTGSIFWNGSLVQSPEEFFLPPRSAYTPQAPFLFSDTLRENILLGLGLSRGQGGGLDADADRLLEAIRQAVLEEDLAELPEGLATRIGPRGHKLSGGQAQRTAAARMFVRNPELCFLDDMSSALDAETEGLLWKRLREGRRRSCLAVSHRPETLALADKVLVLAEGRVEAFGPLEEVLASSAEMRELWGKRSRSGS